MSSPILTILIVTHNHASYIAEGLESILAQKTKYPYQIIVVDDGSDDKTPDILRRYAKKHKNIAIYLGKENTKTDVRAVRASGIKITTKYVAYLDGDDYWIGDDKIETQIGFLEKNSKFIGSCHAHQIAYIHNNRTKQARVSGKDEWDIDELIKYERALYCHTATWVWRNIFKTPYFPPEMFKHDMHGDPIVYHLYLQYGPVKYFDKIMSCYRYTKTGIWTSLSRKQQDYFNCQIFSNIAKVIKPQYRERVRKYYQKQVNLYYGRHGSLYKIITDKDLKLSPCLLYKIKYQVRRILNFLEELN